MSFQDNPAAITWWLHLQSPPGVLYDMVATDGVPQADRTEVIAGWVSVLLALKAAVDFGVDLRNHDRQRTWDERFAEN